jgi:ribonucleotide reductase, class II
VLKTGYEEYIHKSRYARYLPEQQRRETWSETVKRYVDYFEARGSLPKKHKEEVFDAIYGCEVMPSMRAMMTAGKALDRDNVAGFNCSYLVVDHPRSFDELMYILMCGTGVGFSVERQYVSKLPEVAEKFYETDTVIHVADSKVGWAKSYRELISLLYSGQLAKWDVSKVRPAGTALKTFGGRASGPEPLTDLFRFTTEVFRNAAGRKLTSLECHDLCCKVAQIVVVGGVRRSALISLSNLTDDRIRRAKHGQWWVDTPYRGLANNSACYTDKPDFSAFLSEWSSLYESKSGERGFFSRIASQKQAAKNGRRDASYDFGTNPCCVSADTEVLTDDGYFPISELVGVSSVVWNGESFEPVVPYEAGVGDLYRVTLSDGSYLDCTSNHRWCAGGDFVTTEDLLVGTKLDKFDMPVVDKGGESFLQEPYSQGFYAGDGNKGYTFSWIYEPKYCCIPVLEESGRVKDDIPGRKRWDHGPMLDKSYVPIEEHVENKLKWLAGLLDADGTITRDKNGNGFQIASIDHDFLNRVRLMLTTLGCRAKVVSGNVAGLRSMPDGKGGMKDYECKETKRLLIGNTDAYNLMEMGLKYELRRLKHNGKTPQRDARQFVKVVSIEDLGRTEMTYCFTEPKTSRGTFNGIVTGNSEIILRPNQFCNLSEVVVRPNDTLETLKKKVRVATILGTLQASLTDFRYLRSVWRRNTEEEALLGVSLTGIMDNNLLNNADDGHLPELLTSLKEVAIETNKEWAKKIGINQSAAITCVKPSGTVSQLVDSASGIHARFAPFYIRRVRADMRDPLCNVLEAAGVPCETDVTSPTTKVFSFPKKAPDDAVFASEETGMSQLKLWDIYQRHWCEHKPSITVYYRDNEFLEIGQWMYNNFDSVSGVSFLPYSEHTYEQAPYEAITEEKYNELMQGFPTDFNWDIMEQSDVTEGAQTLACVAGACEI